MNTLNIKVKKSELVTAIEDNCSGFGDPFESLYVDSNGNIDCSSNSNDFKILSFAGMGEYIDNNGLYPEDKEYDSRGVAEYIVEDCECLTLRGEYTNNDGDYSEYTIQITE